MAEWEIVPPGVAAGADRTALEFWHNYDNDSWFLPVVAGELESTMFADGVVVVAVPAEVVALVSQAHAALNDVLNRAVGRVLHPNTCAAMSACQRFTPASIREQQLDDECTACGWTFAEHTVDAVEGVDRG